MARKKKRGSGKARNVPPEEEPVAALQTEAEANTVEEEVPQNSSGGGEGPIASAEEASRKHGETIYKLDRDDSDPTSLLG